jgi:hypothetical protein
MSASATEHQDDTLNSVHDPALRVGSTFPSSYTVVRAGEELIGHSLELAPSQIASRRTVVLAKGLNDDRAHSEVARHNTRRIHRLSFGTAKQGANSRE